MRALAVIFCLIATLAGAVEPDEVLEDAALEARARSLSQELRCPVCQSENIDESNAAIAKDMRVVVRERLLAGDSDDQILTFMINRYGEYVLFRPPLTSGNLLLWLAGPAFLLIGGGIVVMFLRGRTATTTPAAPLSEDEERELAALMERERDA